VKPQSNIEKFVKGASIATEAARDEQLLGRMQEAYRHAGAGAASARYPDFWGWLFQSRLVGLAVAALILLSLVILVGEFGTALTGSNVAWADVSQRFQFEPFFYASIYVKEDTLAQPQQFELWMGKGGYLRMRVGAQVIFGHNGQVTHAFDIRRRAEVEADPMAVDIVRMLAAPAEFSFDTVIQSISGGKLVDITPAMNTQAAVSRDLIVFDAQSVVSPGWVRIYVLRQSKLPVGLRIWDPAEGFVVDALITYSKEQPAIFFDPQAFAARLNEPGSETSLAYLFLKDPGGQDVTPNDLPQ
jgi:hypothetical protein